MPVLGHLPLVATLVILPEQYSPLELALGFALSLFSRTPLEVMFSLHFLVHRYFVWIWIIFLFVKASIATFNLLPVLRNGFAAAGFFNASVSSSKAVDALSAAAVVGMVYFSGKNTTVSKALVPLVFGI
jgi:hypothetical protein